MGNNALLTRPHGVSRGWIDSRVRILWRELMSVLAMSLKAIPAAFAARRDSFGESLFGHIISSVHPKTFNTLAITFWCEAKILSRKWMAALAMGFAAIYRRKRLAVFHRIYALRNHTKMLWIHASAVAANMVNYQSLWDRTAKCLIRNAMRPRRGSVPKSVTSGFHSGIAVAVSQLCPIPATRGWINDRTFKNALRKWFRSLHGISIPCTQANVNPLGVD
jgi:hypothetical protein